MSTTTYDRFVQLRAYLMRISPFFSTLLLHTSVKTTTSIPTMAVTSSKQTSTPGTILINPDFASTLSDNQFMAVVCHEVLHLALKHLSRAKSLLSAVAVHPVQHPVQVPTTPGKAPYNHTLFNIAADIIVNGIIESGELSDHLPPGAMTEKSYAELIGADPTSPATMVAGGGTKGLSEWSLEAVYKRLLLDASVSAPTIEVNLCISPADAEGTDASVSPDVAEGTDVDAWDEILETAKVAHQLKAGDRSSLLRHLNNFQANSSTTDYRSILAQFVFRSSETWDDSYDRRFIHSHTYIDVPHSDTLDLEIYIDTSGSINHTLLTKFLSELGANLLLSRWATIRFKSWFFDTELYAGPTSLDELLSLGKDKIPGGGGTDFGCLARKKSSTYVLSEPSARVAMVYTDGWSYDLYDGDHYAQAFETNNVLWVFPPREQTNLDMAELAQEMGHQYLHLSMTL